MLIQLCLLFGWKLRMQQANVKRLVSWIKGSNSLLFTLYLLVQLWTSNNYYWYMKQHLVFANDEDIVGFQWDVESPLCAHIATSGKHMVYGSC